MSEGEIIGQAHSVPATIDLSAKHSPAIHAHAVIRLPTIATAMAVTTAGRSSTTRLVHMFEAFRELAGGHDIIRAFDDMGAALEWLEVQP